MGKINLPLFHFESYSLIYIQKIYFLVVARGIEDPNLSHSMYLTNTPDFSKLPNLEKLIKKDCQTLSEVHSSVCF